MLRLLLLCLQFCLCQLTLLLPSSSLFLLPSSSLFLLLPFPPRFLLLLSSLLQLLNTSLCALVLGVVGRHGRWWWWLCLRMETDSTKKSTYDK